MISVRLLALAILLPSAAMPQQAELALPSDAPEELRTVLENASLTLSLEGEGLDAAQDYVAAARADYRRLLTGLYSEGYYGGVIDIEIDGREASTIEPLDAPDTIGQVVLAVTPGPRFTFGRVAVSPLAPATVLPLGFASGEVARSETIREAVRVAVAAWRDEGNALAAVESQDILADQPRGVLDVGVAIAPGPRLSFGTVTVTGNDDVRTARILRIAGIPSGEVFSPAALERASTRLRRAGAFDSVTIVEADAAEPGDTLPIELQVVESLPRRLGFAAEISSLDGVSAQAFLLNRNLLGGAERLRFEAEVSGVEGVALDTQGGGVDYALGATFSRPATFAPDNDLTLAARIEREDAQDYLLDQFTLDAGIIRYASDALTLSAAVGLLVASEETPIAERDYALVTLPLGAVLDRRDDPRDATAGFFIDANATPFLAVAGEAGSGARLYADARAYRTLGSRLTVAARGQVGSVVGADRDEVPVDFLFFSGGGGSVRGQPFESLGVEVPDPDAPGETVTLGAASLVGVQLEARVGITEQIGAVAFYDAGLTGADAFVSDDADFHAGTGLGVRYDTAIGPVRLDVATPANGDDAFGAVQVYIGIGQSF